MAAVTVVITSYNQGPLIREAVESALTQTVRPQRIIIVDDGSDDAASIDALSAILDDCRHGAKIGRAAAGGVAVDLIGQPNAGPSAARNRGISAAETPVVVVLDGDDRLLPEFIERTLPLLEGDGAMVAASGWLRTFGVLDSVVRPSGGGASAFVARNCCPATCLIRRSAWERCGGYDESMRSGFEDWDFFLSMLESAGGADGADGVDGAHIGIVPEPLIAYRTAPVSSNVTSMAKRLDLMRFLIAKHHGLYAGHLADAVLGVEAISMRRLAMWESLMRGDAEASKAFMAHPTYGDGGMAAAVRLRS